MHAHTHPWNPACFMLFVAFQPWSGFQIVVTAFCLCHSDVASYMTVPTVFVDVAVPMVILQYVIMYVSDHLIQKAVYFYVIKFWNYTRSLFTYPIRLFTWTFESIQVTSAASKRLRHECTSLLELSDCTSGVFVLGDTQSRLIGQHPIVSLC